MTTLAILADIHGNLPALEAVSADMQPFAPDHVIVAGDLINGAPQNIGHYLIQVDGVTVLVNDPDALQGATQHSLD